MALRRWTTYAAGHISVKTNSVIACRYSTSPFENVNAEVRDKPVSSATYSVPPKKRRAMMDRGMSAAGVPSLWIS